MPRLTADILMNSDKSHKNDTRCCWTWPTFPAPLTQCFWISRQLIVLLQGAHRFAEGELSTWTCLLYLAWLIQMLWHDFFWCSRPMRFHEFVSWLIGFFGVGPYHILLLCNSRNGGSFYRLSPELIMTWFFPAHELKLVHNYFPSFEGFRETFNMRESIKQKSTKKRCCKAKGRNTYAIAETKRVVKVELCRLYIHHRLSNTSQNDVGDGGARSLNSITTCSIPSLCTPQEIDRNSQPTSTIYTSRADWAIGALEDSLPTISETWPQPILNCKFCLTRLSQSGTCNNTI